MGESRLVARSAPAPRQQIGTMLSRGEDLALPSHGPLISHLGRWLACALGLHAFSSRSGSTQPGQSDPDHTAPVGMSMSGAGTPFPSPGAAGCLLISISEVADKKGPPSPCPGPPHSPRNTDTLRETQHEGPCAMSWWTWWRVPSAERGKSTAGSKTASDSWKAGKMGKEKEMQANREYWIFCY